MHVCAYMYVYGHIHVCICVQFDLRGHNYIPILFGYLYPNTYIVMDLTSQIRQQVSLLDNSTGYILSKHVPHNVHHWSQE